MSFFCRHDWSMQQTDKMPSAIEQLGMKMESLESLKADMRMFRQKWIYWLRCKKCDKLKKVEVVNTAF